MTVERVDLDRLADYIGGALDGTPDAAVVRRLVDSDPGWAAAHGGLVAAMNSVQQELALFGTAPEPVPDDVAARLDGVLRQPETEPETVPPARLTALDGGRADTARDARRAGATGPGRRGRRARWAVGLSAAAAVIAVGAGLVSLLPPGGGRDAASTAGGAAEAPAAVPDSATGQRATVSGNDYGPGSFRGLGAPTADTLELAPDGVARSAGGRADAAPKAAAEAPAELARFTDPATLRGCLAAITGSFGGSVRATELARFQGRPAVVVLLAGARPAAGRAWVVVAGVDCGTGGHPDELYNGPLA